MNGLGDIGAALRSRHSKDLIVPECKDGSTIYGGHRRLDYWVLRSSWAHPAMIGYEVKSGRPDFLADTKWRDYLGLCNELWFIAPKGAIGPEELPPEVGLLRLAGTRLITVRRAVWREIPVPDGLLTYVLMCRTRIKSECREDSDANREYWGRWLAEKKWDYRLGHRVSRGLREVYARDVSEVRVENDRLRREVAALAEVRDALDARGIHWQGWGAQAVVDQVTASAWTRSQVKAARDALSKLIPEDSDGG